METNPLDEIITANLDSKPPGNGPDVAVAEPAVTGPVDDPDETKSLPPMTEAEASKAAEEVARLEAEKGAAEKAAKEKADAEAAIKKADEAHKEVLEAIKKEEDAKEAAKWAQVGTADSASSTASTKVNVLKMGLTKNIETYASDAYDNAYDAVKAVVFDDLKEAVMDCTHRDLEIKLPRVEFTDAYVRYAVELHENKSGDDTRQIVWCFLDIQFVTGWPIKISNNQRGRARFEPVAIADKEQLEAFFGRELKRKIDDSEVTKLILQYQTKKEIK